MNEFIKKQKLFKRIRNISAITMAVVIFVYIGIEPYLQKTFNSIGYIQLILFALVICVLTIEFLYESKFSKAVKYLDDIKLQINDAGYYISSREENDINSYFEAVKSSLKDMGYKLFDNVEADEFNIDLYAEKQREYIYIVKLDSVDRNDVIAYMDSARNDIMSVKLKNKGECAVIFITDKAEDSAVALSKSTVSVIVSRYNSITFSPAIAEVGTKRVYFLGNKVSRFQKIVANHVMNCALPIKDKYICADKLEFQNKLEKDMEDFNITDFKNGKYYER